MMVDCGEDRETTFPPRPATLWMCVDQKTKILFRWNRVRAFFYALLQVPNQTRNFASWFVLTYFSFTTWLLCTTCYVFLFFHYLIHLRSIICSLETKLNRFRTSSSSALQGEKTFVVFSVASRWCLVVGKCFPRFFFLFLFCLVKKPK